MVSAPPALAQAAGQPAGAVVVQVGDVDPPVDRGVLVRTGDASPAPALAVLVGLSVVGATLAAITARRRTLHPRAVERATGVMAGRRARTDLRGLPASPGSASRSVRRDAPRTRPPAVAGLPTRVPTGDPASPVETRRPQRASSASGPGQD